MAAAVVSRYKLTPGAARRAACLYATDPAKSSVREWMGMAKFTTRNDGATLFSHVVLPAGGLGSGGLVWGGLAMGTAVEVEAVITDARNMVHARTGNQGAGICGQGDNFLTIDTVLPGESQLVAVVAPVDSDFSYRTNMRYRTVPGFDMAAGVVSHLLAGGRSASSGLGSYRNTPPVNPESLFAPHRA
mmetsp:Transcript_13057/g.30838  ORF Transcript_13057/g.30838 Transcript_13057/m.30838 type:complete len:188 (+) Transcript_13057:722-1285(+)